MKKRLDVLLVEQGLAESREKAKAIIMSGIVYVDNEKEDKAGSTFEETCQVEVRGKFVLMAGLLLIIITRESKAIFKLLLLKSIS